MVFGGMPKPNINSQTVLGIFLFLLSLVLGCMLVLVWPTPGDNNAVTSILLGPKSPQIHFLILSMIAGAFGSSFSAARNFAVFQGVGKYTESWTWWYVMNPVVGMGLGVLLFLILQAGLFSISLSSTNSALQNANPAGFTAIAILGGMFARNAIEKLEEAFNTFLKPKDKPAAPVQPVISKIEPTEKLVDDPDRKIVVSGENFDAKASVTVNGKQFTPSNSGGKLTVTLEATDLAKAGKLPVIVTNPAGGASKPVDLTVKA